MASEDTDASVIVHSRLDLAKGHRYGPYKGRIKPLPEDGELAFGAWKVFMEGDERNLTFESNDSSLPNWLRFIKPTEDNAVQNITLVERGKTFFFEITRDMAKGEEYALMGRRVEELPPEEQVKKRGPGRPRKVKPSPEDRIAIHEALQEANAQATEPESSRGRSRKCTLCSKIFTSSVLFMKHRQECAIIREEEILREIDNDHEEEEDDEEEEEDVMEQDGQEGLDGTGGLGQFLDAVDGELRLQENIVAEPDEGNGTPQMKPTTTHKHVWPIHTKRPVGRPRKDGRPPIPRKKRRGRRKRKRLDDDEDFPGRNIKITKDECIPSVVDPEKFPFTCDVCDKIFATQTWRDYHCEQHETPLLTYLVCNLCDEAFKFLTEYNVHMEEIHTELDKRERVLSNKFRCDTCKKAFRSPIHMERHRRRAAAEEPLPKGPVQVKCKYCEKSFSMEQGLMNHTIRYHPEHKRFQCTANDCMESFHDKDERAIHLEETHQLDPRQIYKCPVELCDKAYTTMAALNYHYELQHTATSRPFTCELCGKAWVKIGKLREHLKTHSTEKNELCDECGRAFKSRPELKDHKMEMHTEAGREKLNCRYCTATFSRRSSRSYHERRHRNDAPYLCPKPGCNKRFIAVIDYKRHLIFHTGAKLYRCRYCNNCFTRSDYLKGHEKKHHVRGELVDVGPPIEETVTIKVPWPMEKAVKIQGQNVVVIIEPDPTLADVSLAADAMAALDSIHNVDGDNNIQIPVQMSTERIGDQHLITTSVVSSENNTNDIIQQAAQQAMQQSTSESSPQLIQLDQQVMMDTSASAAMQQAVAQAAMAAAAAASGTALQTTNVNDTTHQIYLQTSDEVIQEQAITEDMIMEGATSEQDAIKMAIQQFSTDGTHVVLQPATAQHTEMGTTMQATLQGEDGQTQIVMVNLAPGTVLTDVDGNVSVTSGVTTDGVVTMTEGNVQEVQTDQDVSGDVSIQFQQDGEGGETVCYVTDDKDGSSQEVAIATAQMQAVTEQMDAAGEADDVAGMTQTVVSTEAVDQNGTVTSIAYSDISHTLTTV